NGCGWKRGRGEYSSAPSGREDFGRSHSIRDGAVARAQSPRTKIPARLKTARRAAILSGRRQLWNEIADAKLDVWKTQRRHTFVDPENTRLAILRARRITVHFEHVLLEI